MYRMSMLMEKETDMPSKMKEGLQKKIGAKIDERSY